MLINGVFILETVCMDNCFLELKKIKNIFPKTKERDSLTKSQTVNHFMLTVVTVTKWREMGTLCLPEQTFHGNIPSLRNIHSSNINLFSVEMWKVRCSVHCI